MKIKTLFFVLIMLITGNSYSQSWFGGFYSTAGLTNNSHDYISKYSYRGLGIDYRTHLGPHCLVGFSTAINLFNEKLDYGSYTYETVTISGVQNRSMTTFPILAAFDYCDTIYKNLQWFAGAGIGTAYVNHYTDFGSYTFERDAWQFLLAPEAGIVYPVSRSSSVYLSVRYNQGFETKSMNGQSYFSINIGLGGPF